MQNNREETQATSPNPQQNNPQQNDNQQTNNQHAAVYSPNNNFGGLFSALIPEPTNHTDEKAPFKKRKKKKRRYGRQT
ncbi:MAG: hypothetical protein LBH92_01910 [Bacteroidales bacterium]|nr:hypothetical protein [Bacteroidales bacterium]